MRDFLNKMTGFEVLGVPVGASGLLLVAMGIGGALMNGAQRMINAPPILGGPGLAVLVTRGFVKRYVGDGPAALIASGFMVQAADQQFAAVDRIAGLIPLGEGYGFAAEELGEGAAAGQLGEGDLGQGEAAYLTDVERKVQGLMRAQI